MHKIGDIVRLNRGWTPMCVIGFDNDGEVMASYFNYSGGSQPCSITQKSYKNPQDFYDYIRPHNGFIVWDGDHFKMKVPKPMPQQFKTTGRFVEFGTFLSQTSSGDVVLEMANGEVKVFKPSDIQENIPYTFEVKSVGQHHYKCHYSLPDGVTGVTKNDMLLSDSGNAYVVVRTDTAYRNPKGVFKGTRLVQQAL